MLRQIAIRSGGIAVATRGPAAGHAVVFLNSLGTDLRVWDDVVDRLPEALRLIRMDKRGHGLSSVTPAAFRIEDHAEDVADVIEALGAGPALVVGLSIGGLIGQALALQRPDLVRGLLLLDTGQRVGTSEAWEARIAAVEAGGLESIVDAVMERWFSPSFRMHRPEVIAAWRALVARMPPSGYIAACRALRDGDLTSRVGALRLPVRFAAGSLDLATPPDLVKAAAERIPGARFSVIEGVGHLPPVESPGEVADMILTLAKETGLA